MIRYDPYSEIPWDELNVRSAKLPEVSDTVTRENRTFKITRRGTYSTSRYLHSVALRTLKRTKWLWSRPCVEQTYQL